MNNWTIIFLVSAENNLINESVKAIEEIYRAGSNEQVKFLIIFDGLKYGKFSREFAKPSLYEVNADNGFFTEKKVTHYNSDNLAKPETLNYFLAYIKKNYPAKNYGFFYKGHGGSGGTDISSAVFMEKLFKLPPNIIDNEEKVEAYVTEHFSKRYELDGVYNYMGYVKNKKARRYVMAIFTRTKNVKSLSYQSIAVCIKKVFKQKIGFVCLDCCWGQQIENAFVFAHAAEYVVASADESPALGIGYQELCSRINQRPQIRPEEIANLIIAVYFYRNYSDYDSPVAEFRKMGVSITNIKTQLLKKTTGSNANSFEEKMKNLCDYLIKNISKFKQIILPARKKCKDYTYKDTESLDPAHIMYPVFNIDLPWFLTNLRYYNQEKDEKLDTLINDILLFIETSMIKGFLSSNYRNPILGNRTAYTGGNGLSILFPISKIQAEGCDSLYKSKTHPFYVKTNWLNFLSAYYEDLEKINKSTSYTSVWNKDNSLQMPNLYFNLKNKAFNEGKNIEAFTYSRFKIQANKSNENTSDWSSIMKWQKKVKLKRNR
jgi:hypothetical protein